MSYLTTKDGTRLFYRDWGEGRPVVFISGWALSSDMWNAQMIDLSGKGLRCIAFDRRGHGRSDDPGRGYDYDTLADDLAAILEHLSLCGVTLVAHSMGGGEIVRYITRRGTARIDRCAFVASGLPFPLKTADNPLGFDRAAPDRNRAMFRSDFPRWLADNEGPYFGYGLPGCSVSSEVGEWTRMDMLRTSLKAALDCNLTLIETDFRAELRAWTLPTLLIHGDRDRSFPVEMSAMQAAKLMPDARFILYENAPHGLYISHKERLNADLLEFVTGEAAE